MNIRRNLLATALAAVFALGAAVPALAADAHQHGSGEPAKLTLNHGKKWASDEPLRKNMAEVRAALGAKQTGIHKGTLTPDGAIEIGYAVRADFQGRGIATEAAAALIARAFADGRVEAVIAETLAHLLPSIRVLEKLGFVAVAGGSGPDVLRFERRRGPSEACNP